MRIAALIGICGSLLLLSSPAYASPARDTDGRSGSVAADGPNNGWSFEKEDPATKRLLATIYASSYQRTGNPFVIRLTGVTVKIWRPTSASYSHLNLKSALLDEKSGALIYGTNLTVITIP